MFYFFQHFTQINDGNSTTTFPIYSTTNSRSIELHSLISKSQLKQEKPVRFGENSQEQSTEFSLRNLWISVILSIGFIILVIYILYMTINPTTRNNVSNFVDDPSCSDSCCIFCNSPMSNIIQSYNFWGDSKYFVDMPLKKHPSQIISLWNDEIISSNLTNNATAVYNFVMKYFEEPGSDISECLPIDYTDDISNSLISQIFDKKLQKFTLEIYPLWKQLCRTINESVYLNPERHSLLPMKYSQMIISGGRFREIYYWDSYWIIKGLLVCNMSKSAKMTMKNIMYLSSEYGHMLNGNRIYYQNRSQPPLLALMVNLIYKYENNNDTWIKHNKEYIYILKHDYEWWMRTQSINIRNNTLNLYKIMSDKPRPEGYVEDTLLVSLLQNQTVASYKNAYSSVRSGAEAGWDFTSRWCTHLYCQHNLINIDTINIIPVELNAYFYKIEYLLYKFFKIIGDYTNSKYFLQKSIDRLNAINNILWDKNEKIWKDWNLRENKFMNDKSISNYIPLWVLPYNLTLAEIILNNLNNSGLIRLGGVVTTNINDTQQWDYPNAWPPIQYIIAEMCKKYSNQLDLAKLIEQNVTQTFIKTSYIGWYETGYMHEKYNVLKLGREGKGGEYTPQTGFGWTNAVAFSFLHDYGNVLTAPSDF